MKENDPLSQWLLSVIKNPQINAARQALKAGANCNQAIDPESKRTALQETIVGDQLDLLTLLLEGDPQHPDKKADINKVGYEFEACIELAAKTVLTKKMEMMQLLIERRNLIEREALVQSAGLCAIQLEALPWREAEFARLANAISRLCGVHIGKILSEDNNDDRYLVHLCQYSYAEKNDNELEGWEAYEFFPIRIFSLFEILVKLKKGFLQISSEHLEFYEKFLTDEILLEIETFKLLQESEAIDEAVGFSEEEKNNLYTLLATVFIDRLQKNEGKEFCLVSGYRGHTIYISFCYFGGNFTIRYDNLGVGIKKIDGSPRHLIQGGKVYPKEITVAATNEEAIRNYLVCLWRVKKENIPGSDYREYQNDEMEEKRSAYKLGREEKLRLIYDDANVLNSQGMQVNEHGMFEQEADTCVATSHQVGLLVRTNSQSFYHWIVAEEKRCIVQINRNEGARLAHRDSYWEMDEKINFQELFEYPRCCPTEILDKAYTTHVEMFLQKNLNFLAYQDFREQLILSLNGHNNFKELQKNIAAIRTELESRENISENIISFILMLTFFNGILFIKRALTEENGLQQYRYFDEAYHCLYTYYKNKSEFSVVYLLGLTAFFAQRFTEADEKFKMCLAIAESLERNPSFYHARQDELTLAQKRNFIYLSLGFLNIAQGNYNEAERLFNMTVRETNEKDGLRYVGQTFTHAPSEAWLGLGIISFYRYKNSVTPIEKATHAFSAMRGLPRSKGGNNPNVCRTAEKFIQILGSEINLALQGESSTTSKKRDHDDIESSDGVSSTSTDTNSTKRQKKPESPLSVGQNPHGSFAGRNVEVPKQLTEAEKPPEQSPQQSPAM